MACAPPAVCSEHCRNVKWSHRQLRFASMSYASTLMPGRRYMASLAHLPMLFQESPKEALVVCFGTGTTAGTFTRYPSLESLTVVDLNKDVLDAARLFESSNYGVVGDPRVHLTVDDGRHFLLATPRRFDVISFEPPPPTAAGVVSLYTREFYELVAARLTEHGVLAQWIPLDDQADLHDRMLVKSVLETFTDVVMFIPSRHEAVVVASRRPLAIDVPRWYSRWNEPTVRDAMREVGFDTPEHLVGTFVAGRAGLERWTRGVAAVTDDLPAVEYFFQRNDGPFRLRELLEPTADIGPLLRSATADDAARVEALRRANDLLLQAHEAAVLARDGARARSLVAEAARVGGPTAYTEYEEAIEYGCLGP
jgi:spermidine synthase